MMEACPVIRYCSCVASTQNTVSMIGLGRICEFFGVRMSVVVTRRGSGGAASAVRNSRRMCERTRGVLVEGSMDASWNTVIRLREAGDL